MVIHHKIPRKPRSTPRTDYQKVVEYIGKKKAKLASLIFGFLIYMRLVQGVEGRSVALKSTRIALFRLQLLDNLRKQYFERVIYHGDPERFAPKMSVTMVGASYMTLATNWTRLGGLRGTLRGEEPLLEVLQPLIKSAFKKYYESNLPRLFWWNS
jgi:hypothetical protein